MDQKKPSPTAGSYILQTLLLVTMFVVVGICWHKFAYTKDFRFSLEAPCDASSQTCYVRSCDGEGDYCPPNGLKVYRVFMISAKDFDSCTDDSCLDECLSGSILCEEIMCVEDEFTSCSDL